MWWCGGVVCGGVVVCGSVSMNFKSTTEPVDEYLLKTSTPSDQPQRTHVFRNPPEDDSPRPKGHHLLPMLAQPSPRSWQQRPLLYVRITPLFFLLCVRVVWF